MYKTYDFWVDILVGLSSVACLGLPLALLGVPSLLGTEVDRRQPRCSCVQGANASLATETAAVAVAPAKTRRLGEQVLVILVWTRAAVGRVLFC